MALIVTCTQLQLWGFLDKLAVARIVEHILQTVYRENHAREIHLLIVSLKYVYKGYEFSVSRINRLLVAV